MRLLHTMKMGAMAALAAAGIGAQAASVSLTPDAASVKVGDTFTLQLVGHDFVGLDGGGIDLGFDAAQLRLDSVAVDAAWNFFSDPGSIDNTSGKLTGLSFNVWGPLSGNLHFATLTFSALGVGDTLVSLLPSVMWPFGLGGEVVDVALNDLTVHISAVPEPSQALLLALGLAGLGGGWRVRWRSAHR